MSEKTNEKKFDKKKLTDFLFNNAMYIIIALVIIYVAIKRPAFLGTASIVNIISLTASKLPIALGVAGCIVLAGTDISGGRVVGLSAVVTASLLTTTSKIWPNMTEALPIPVVLLIVLAISGGIGFVNGFAVSKFSLHPYIVTLSTQLITYGIILVYMNSGTNNGQTLSGMTDAYKSLIAGPLFYIGKTAVPKYILYSLVFLVIMWVIWNKTVFGKNMFAVGSNKTAAEVSGVNVNKTIVLVFVLAGIMYGLAGFIDAARVGSATANTGLNYEADAISACVIGGVSFVGGIGSISGLLVGVILLQLIFVALNFLAVNQNMLYIIKGLIILIACAIDMRKYLTKK